MSINLARCQVAILAGGLGTRLKARTGDLPKPMAPVLGRPVLEHLVALCQRHGFTRIALLVHYGSGAIQDHFGDGARWGVQLSYCTEITARGTAGALLDALPCLEDCFLVLYGDTYADIDLARLWQAHAASGAQATLVLHPNDHPHDSDLVEVDALSRVKAVHAYPHPESSVHRNLVNAALYVLQRDALLGVIPREGKADLAKHTFPAMLAAGQCLQGYITPEYIKDMGTPERLDKVEHDLLSGVIDRLSARQPRHAVFLDRDGTLNVEVDHLHSPQQLQLIDGVADAVRQLNRAGVLAVCVTNQPVVARGEVSLQGLERVHATLDQHLGTGRAYLDRLYVCPHHPDRGFPGEVAELKVACDCRKPEPGLIDRAVRELGIARRRSWMVGDTTADIAAGVRAGLRTVLVRTGHAGQDGKHRAEPDYVMPDLAAAVHWILHGHAAMACQLLPLLQASSQARLVLVGGPARAGKSSAARRLAELLEAAGRSAQVLSMDGWLRPVAQRPEGTGVLQRYDIAALLAWLQPLLHGGRRQWLQVPAFERQSRSTRLGPLRSFAAGDVLIVEGVPALMDTALRAAAAVRLHVDASDAARRQRLLADYAWCGAAAADWLARLGQRELDEVPAARASAAFATHRLQGD